MAFYKKHDIEYSENYVARFCYRFHSIKFIFLIFCREQELVTFKQRDRIGSMIRVRKISMSIPYDLVRL